MLNIFCQISENSHILHENRYKIRYKLNFGYKKTLSK